MFRHRYKLGRRQSMGSRRRLGRKEVNTIERDLKKFQIIIIVGLVFGTLGI